MRSARNASSAQYWRNSLTGRPSAAAPAVRVAAACSLSSVPEKSTIEMVSSIWPSAGELIGGRRGVPRHHFGGCASGRNGDSGETAHQDAAHGLAGADDLGIAQPVSHLAPVSFRLDYAGGAHERQVLRHVRLADAHLL